MVRALNLLTRELNSVALSCSPFPILSSLLLRDRKPSFLSGLFRALVCNKRRTLCQHINQRVASFIKKGWLPKTKVPTELNSVHSNKGDLHSVMSSLSQ